MSEVQPSTVSKEWKTYGILAALQDAIPDVRIKAIKELDKLGLLNENFPKEKLPQLVELIEDENPHIRFAVIEILSKQTVLTREFLPLLAPYIAHKNYYVRQAAAEILKNLGEIAKGVVPQILPNIKHWDRNIRWISIQTLGNIGKIPYESIPQIAQYIEGSDLDLRRAAIEALGKLKATEYTSNIAIHLNDKSWCIRLATIQSLNELGAIAYIPQVITLLNDEHPLVRSAAVRYLGNEGKEKESFIPSIKACLKDEDPIVRTDAIMVLNQLGELTEEAIPQLVSSLKENNADLRAASIRALGSLVFLSNIEEGTVNEILSQITSCIKDKNQEVRFATVEVLSRLYSNAEIYLQEILPLIESRQPDIRASVVELLGKLDKITEPYISQILSLLHHKNPEIRATAIQALGYLGEIQYPYFPQIMERIEDKDPNVRIATIRAIGNLGEITEEYISKIVDRLQDEEPNVRVVAIQTLGKLGKRAEIYTSQIGDCLKDDDPNVRRIAIDALDKFKDTGKSNILEFIDPLKDDDPDVIYAIMKTTDNPEKNKFTIVWHILNTIYKTPSKTVELRFLAHFIGGGNDEIEIALKWLGEPENNYPKILTYKETFLKSIIGKHYPGELTYSKAKKTLHIFNVIWESTGDFPYLRSDLTNQIMVLVAKKKQQWKQEDLLLLEKSAKSLKLAYASESADVEKIIDLVEKRIRNSQKIELIKNRFWQKMSDGWKSFETWLSKETNTLWENIKNSFSQSPSLQNIITMIVSLIRIVFYSLCAIFLFIILLFIVLIVYLSSNYPLPERIQSFFSSNSELSKGCIAIILIGYIKITKFLKVIPFLRKKFPEWQRKFFRSFRVSGLLSTDIGTYYLDEEIYFKDSEVDCISLDNEEQEPLKSSDEKFNQLTSRLPIQKAIPAIKGKNFLIGQSGTGKTMLIHYLLKNTANIAFYLIAEECSEGIFKAIQKNLPQVFHLLGDDGEDLLIQLLSEEKVEIYIDNFDKTTSGIREKIIENIEEIMKEMSDVTFLIATREIKNWNSPESFNIYRLLPLRIDQIKKFLLSREKIFTNLPTFSKNDYELSCKEFLFTIFDDQQPKEDFEFAQSILSNPMNITMISQIIAHKKVPNIFLLQEQQYQIVEEEYERLHAEQKFPLMKFSERVYQMRLANEMALSHSEFSDELQCLEYHKMVFNRNRKNTKGGIIKEYCFQHSKIMDFFIATFFENNKNEREEYIGDIRFHDVYLLLAHILPVEEAMKLREKIIDHAVDVDDHTLSNSFIKIIRPRKVKNPDIAKVQSFLEKAGTTVSPWKLEQGLRIIEARGRLRHFIPLAVLVSNDFLTKDDINQFIQYSILLASDKEKNVGILFYGDKVDPVIVRMRIIEARLSQDFIIIPIPLTMVEQSLPDQNKCIGCFNEYVDRYLPGKDLFYQMDAISDSSVFFGRTELLNHLEKDLLRFQQVGLFGLRKVGKTSVLFQLQSLLKAYPTVYIDLQLYIRASRYSVTLFNTICSHLLRLVRERNSGLVTNLKMYEISENSRISVDFVQQITEIAKLLTQVDYKLPIICFLDEIEHILPNQLDSRDQVQEFNAFWGALRVLCQEHHILSLLVADVHPDCNRINQWAQEGVSSNPVYNFFKETFLKPFAQEETCSMITSIGGFMGREFDEQTLIALHKISGGYPFIVRQLASLLCKKIPIEKSPSIGWSDSQNYLENALLYSDKLIDYISGSIWVDLKKRHFDASLSVLRTLASYDNGLTGEDLLVKINPPHPQTQIIKALSWLESVGIIDKQKIDDVEYYQIQIPLLCNWLKMEGEI